MRYVGWKLCRRALGVMFHGRPSKHITITQYIKGRRISTAIIGNLGSALSRITSTDSDQSSGYLANFATSFCNVIILVLYVGVEIAERTNLLILPIRALRETHHRNDNEGRAEVGIDR